MDGVSPYAGIVWRGGIPDSYSSLLLFGQFGFPPLSAQYFLDYVAPAILAVQSKMADDRCGKLRQFFLLFRPRKVIKRAKTCVWLVLFVDTVQSWQGGGGQRKPRRCIRRLRSLVWVSVEGHSGNESCNFWPVDTAQPGLDSQHSIIISWGPETGGFLGGPDAFLGLVNKSQYHGFTPVTPRHLLSPGFFSFLQGELFFSERFSKAWKAGAFRRADKKIRVARSDEHRVV